MSPLNHTHRKSHLTAKSILILSIVKQNTLISHRGGLVAGVTTHSDNMTLMLRG